MIPGVAAVSASQSAANRSSSNTVVAVQESSCLHGLLLNMRVLQHCLSAKVQRGLFAGLGSRRTACWESTSQPSGQTQNLNAGIGYIVATSSLTATVSGDRPQWSRTACKQELHHEIGPWNATRDVSKVAKRGRMKHTELAPCCKRTRTHSLRPCIAAQ